MGPCIAFDCAARMLMLKQAGNSLDESLTGEHLVWGNRMRAALLGAGAPFHEVDRARQRSTWVPQRGYHALHVPIGHEGFSGVADEACFVILGRRRAIVRRSIQRGFK